MTVTTPNNTKAKPENVVDAEIVEENEKWTPSYGTINTFLLIIVSAVAIFGIGGATIISFNLGEWNPAFVVGLFLPALFGIGIRVMWWATHHTTRGKQLAGFIVGLIDAIGFILVTIFFLLLPIAAGEGFPLDKFWWGILTVAILLVVVGFILVYGEFNHKYDNYVNSIES